MQDLVAKQHDVATLALPDDTLYLGPNGWRMTLLLIKHLPVAVKAWRDLQYGVPNKEKATGQDSTKRTTASKPRKRSVKGSSKGDTGSPTGETNTIGETSNSAGLGEPL